jgi:hypothetical protein
LKYTPFSKIREEKVSGRKRWKSGLQVPPTKSEDRLTFRGDDFH